MSGQWMIYGATGYTGRLIAAEAARRRLRPLLAGRDAKSLQRVAGEIAAQTGAPPLETRVFALKIAGLKGGVGAVKALDYPNAIARHLHDVRLVLNCAGPFSATAIPMMEACLRAGAHYLDITGEIDVIEAAAALDERARAAGVCLLPAVGFDVVPSDCLARMVADKLPDATRLVIAFASDGGISPGTMNTALESLSKGTRVRRGGRIEPVSGTAEREFPFPGGIRRAMRVPWGDIASAYYTTGIPNIETYWAASDAERRSFRIGQWIRPLVAIGPVRRWMQRGIRRRMRGPDAQTLANSHSWLFVEAANERGERATATLTTPGGYGLTRDSAIAAALRVLESAGLAGFQTPAMALGKEFVLSLPGVTCHAVEVASG